jgi:acyl-CoA hydrolase/GNAT superfamily N-acetyltransferase
MSIVDGTRNGDCGSPGRYRSMILSAEEAVGHIRPGQRVFIGTGCGQPQALVAALLRRADALDDVEIIHLVTLGEAAFRHKELAQHFCLKPFFIADGVDTGTRSRPGDYTPILFSDIPELFRSGHLPIDVALIQVTEPNEHGLCSLGISVDVTKIAAENAGMVIAQVNPQMPWTTGDGLIRVHDLDVLVPCDEPLLETNLPDPGDTPRRIAEYVAALIPDSSTVQFGVHRIPQALLGFLKSKHDLGIHAEVVSDGIIELLEAGAITGARKSTDRGKIVCSLCLGTKRLYSYVDKNPAFCFRSAEYVSDPAVISRQRNMVAVDLASEIDLMGQVCAHSPETGFSGMASHADFVHGAAKARGGRMIVALESTRCNGTMSQIVPRLSDGAAVAATCFEVHYVVTEHGVAYLHGKSLQERAMALISIAHPDFRAGLLREAIDRGYISSDLATIEGKIHVGPPMLRSSTVLGDGTLVGFRPMHPTDEARMRDLFHSLSKQTMYYRFMSGVARLPQRRVRDFVYVDYRDEMAIVGTVPEASGEEIIAVGRYYLNPGTNRAEVAFIVRDQWQNRGIGTFLLTYLATIARSQGIAGFTAEVLVDNRAMLAVFRKSGFRLRSQLDGRVHSIELDFE